MGTMVAILLIVIAIMLFVAAKNQWIKGETMELLTEVAGIMAFLAAVALFVVPTFTPPAEPTPRPTEQQLTPRPIATTAIPQGPTATDTVTPTPTSTKVSIFTPMPTSSLPTITSPPNPKPSSTVTRPQLELPPWRDKPYCNPIMFKWRGSLSAGQTYRVSVYATEDNKLVAQSELLTRTCWEAHLPAWATYSELAWFVSVISEGSEKITSSKSAFWFSPIGEPTFLSPLCLP